MLRLGLLVLALIQANALAAPIERVEPPNWWLGFQHTQLQLMIYGEGLGNWQASVDQAGIEVLRTVRVTSPNYLFVYLEIDPQTAPGSFQLVLRSGSDVITHDYPLLGKNPDPGHAAGFSAADAIYLITPDRFANGNPDNDNIAGYGDRADRSKLGGRHGGDIQGIAQHLDYLAQMGFTAIWLNPVLENAMPAYSYHGYSTTDFYRVDPRYGSNESYRQLTRSARGRGMGLIMDMIVNHIGSEHWWMDDLPTADWVNYGGEFVHTSHERTTWQDPHASRYDARRFADGWFDRTMPDLNQRNPLLADYLIQNSLWWIEYLGLAGIRMDTYPYPDRTFMADWTERLMAEYPQFNIVGEEWSLNPAIVSYWQRGKVNHDGYVSHLPSLMDFPLREAMRDALLAQPPAYFSSWSPLYQMLANDFQYPDPQSLVIFPDNHDMSRIFTQLGEDEALFRMAMAYVLTMRGIPQIYYGTEILMTNRESDDHGLIRSDFPGGWAGDSVDAFTGQGLTTAQRDAQNYLRKLLTWRRQQPLVHTGKLMHFSPDGPVYSYFRYNDSGSVMVTFNKGEQATSLPLEQYAERLQGYTTAVSVLDGTRFSLSEGISVAPRSVTILELEQASE